MQQPTARRADSFFARFQACAILSFVLLAAATALALDPWIAMLGGGAPLVYYHLGYLAPRAKYGLSQTAIDSVYYFGFLVTITALGVSAVSLAVNDGKMPMNEIAFQFGLGLMATGYAVLARMHLTSISTLVEEASPEAVLDRYIQRSRELVTNVEFASEQFVQLSSNLMVKSQEVAEKARQTTENSMLQVARMFDEELRGTLASARQGLTEIRGLVNETSFVQEREALIRGVKLTLDAVTALNKSLEEFALRAGEGAQTSQTTEVTSRALNDTLTMFLANLGKIAAADGPLLETAKSIAHAQAAIGEGTAVMTQIVDRLSDMAENVSGLGVTFKNIRTVSSKANEQMDSLVSSAERLGEATQHIERSATATAALATGLDQAAAALPTLGQHAEALDVRFVGLAKSVGDLQMHLVSVPGPVDEVLKRSVELTGTLGAVAQVLVSISAEAKALAEHTSRHAEALQQAGRTADEIRELQFATDSVKKLIGELGETVGQLNEAVASSSGPLKAAVDAATSSLEADVRRSTETARVFGERLTQVAQIIIDRTRAGSQT